MADTTLNYDDLRKVVSEADEDGNAELDVEEVRTAVDNDQCEVCHRQSRMDFPKKGVWV